MRCLALFEVGAESPVFVAVGPDVQDVNMELSSGAKLERYEFFLPGADPEWLLHNLKRCVAS